MIIEGQAVEKDTVVTVLRIGGVRRLMAGKAGGRYSCLGEIWRGRGDREGEGDGQMRFWRVNFRNCRLLECRQYCVFLSGTFAF